MVQGPLNSLVPHEFLDRADNFFSAINHTVKAGRVLLPDAPGLGIKVNFAEFARKCPHKAIRSRAQLKL